MLPTIQLERPALLDFESSLRYEWLVTNGLGSYASGTVLGVDTRRYHGLLVAALTPPAGRTLLLARVHEQLETDASICPLHSSEYHDGTIDPPGHLFLDAFRLEGTLPVWRYRCRDVVLEKSLWLERERNTVFILYRLLAARNPVSLTLEPFAAHRDFHAHTRGDPAWRFGLEAYADGCRIEAFAGAPPLWLSLPGGRFSQTGIWYWSFLHRRERQRGLDDVEDLYTPGVFVVQMIEGTTATLIATMHREDLNLDPLASLERERGRQGRLLKQAKATSEDPIRQDLVLAADQFLVKRGTTGSTIVAGYHWFADWGRDTMIALPGLCLVTGRAREGRAILSTFAAYLDQGLLPNRFPEEGQQPEYNTVDATLWFFEAIARYERSTGDRTLVDELLPALAEVVAWHQRGTRHGIAVDASDGLLRAGEAGLQLTWMDARVGDWVVTRRSGKPVEAQALWYNALRLLAGWLTERDQDATALTDAAERCRASFNRRFWDPARGHCLDVVDGEDGDDPALRPNQLLAASLSHPVLDPAYWEPMLNAVERALLTPVGLRTLAPTEPGYVGSYAGDQARRDSAYHQGTVWPWLIGPYVDVARRVHGEEWDARPALLGLARHLHQAGLGQVSEIFSGDPPHPPVGCIAQGWSVGELLRVWTETCASGTTKDEGPGYAS